jgi:hypothetical protein
VTRLTDKQSFAMLVGKVAIQDFPLLPEPTWAQDAAYVAWVIDKTRGIVETQGAEIERLRVLVQDLIDTDRIPVGDLNRILPDDYTPHEAERAA